MIYLLGLALIGAYFATTQTAVGGELIQSVEDKVQENLPAWNKFDSMFQQYANEFDLDWQWLKAFALNESSLGDAPSVAIGLANPSDIEGSKSSDGKSWGLMQVTIKTAQGLDPGATEEMLNNPDYSIMLAAKLIDQNKKQFSSLDPRYLEWVVKSYNQGAGNTKKESQGHVGYADEYWARWQRNLKRVQENA